MRFVDLNDWMFAQFQFGGCWAPWWCEPERMCYDVLDCFGLFCRPGTGQCRFSGMVVTEV